VFFRPQSLSIKYRAYALVAITVVTVMAYFWVAPARAHDWYPEECCHGKDCAPVQSMEWVDAYGASHLYVTSRDGTVVIPPNFPWRVSPDGRMHVCMRRTFDDGMEVICLFNPPGT
jgi:hypothetical protein